MAARTEAETFHREADRRQATILFADLSGFTGLSERLDPEQVREFQKDFFEALTQAVKRHDGFVAKLMGDAVLAVFGAPVAHEDDPERALNTALDMLVRSTRLSEQWQSRLGQPVTLHIAVHCGPVVAGTLAHATGATYDVTGDTVNTASRLLSVASSGAVVVSGAMHELTRHRFAFELAGEVALRGKTDPIAVYRLKGALAQPRSARGLETLGLKAPFVGRSNDLRQLTGAFQRMQQGQAQLVNLIGEAGTGKSRLIAEFLAQLEADNQLAGVAVRRVACSAMGEPTYGVFATLFREGYRVEPTDSLEIVRGKLFAGLSELGAQDEETEAIVPVLSYVLGVEETTPCEIDPEQLQRQIALAAHILLERRLEQQSLFIIVEDLHWADTASVDLIRQLADQFADRPLMLLLSLRPDTRRSLVVERVAQSVLRLDPLSPEDTRALVLELFGSSLADSVAHLQDLVARQAGGNPLFVEEIVRSLISKGLLVRDGDRWICASAGEAVDVPPNLQGLLLSRVDQMPADARRLLQEAAVIGTEFDEPLLRAVTDSSAGAFGVEQLIKTDFVQPLKQRGGGNRYGFTHALVHEVVYRNLLLADRTELHGRVGRALEAAVGSHPERLSDVEALGHHWSLSADKARGARYLIDAGEWARAVYANEDAIRHYGRALRTLGECQDCGSEARLVRERLGDLLALTGRGAEGLAHYENVLQECERDGDAAATARLHRKIGCLHWDRGERDLAAACFTSGLEKLANGGDAIELAHLLHEMGRLAFRAGDTAAAIEWSERALSEIADESSTDPQRQRELAAMRAQAYNTLGVAFARDGRVNEAVEQIERSIELAEVHDLLQAACRGFTNLSVLYSSLHPRRSIETCLRGLEIAKKVGDLAFQSRLYANLAASYCALTDRCEIEGIEAAKMAIDLDRRLGLVDHLPVPLIVYGQIQQCHGDSALAFASYEEALGLAERVGEPQLLFPCYDGLATLHLDAGDQVSAEVYLAKAQKVCERAGVEPDALMVLPFLC